MIRRLILLAVALMLTCVSAVAAPNDIKCSGVLVAEDGEPIIGATISVPGTKNRGDDRCRRAFYPDRSQG